MQESPKMGAGLQSPMSNAAVIGPGIQITGDVTSSTDLFVDGQVIGSVIQSTDSVEIGESGQVSARIRAKLVKVSGEVKGDISGIEKVLISKTGRVLGNIVAPRVQLEDGAIFRGSIDMTPAKTIKPKVPVQEKQQEKATAPLGGTGKPQAPATAKPVGSAPSTSSGRKEPSLTLKSG